MSSWEDALSEILQGEKLTQTSSRGFRFKDPLQSAVASLLVFGFSGAQVNAHAKRLIEIGAGGVILFARNYEDPEQVSKLCLELKKLAAPRKLLVMIDQEGGRVSRLGPPFSLLPTPRTVGQTRDLKLAKAAGYILGRELRAVNIDMDLAPVVDVDTNPKNPVIGDRSFGISPDIVGDNASAVVQGLQDEGVAACAKHYPGHGDTSIDSHLALPHLTHDLKRLEKIELAPFKMVVEAGIAAVMVAHLWTPALDEFASKPESISTVAATVAPTVAGDGEVAHIPATLSKAPLSYLRNKLGFNGAIVTDDMEMGAITKHMTVPEATVRAVEAGVDLVLLCHTEKVQVSAFESLLEAAKQGRVTKPRLVESLQRVHEVKRRFCKGVGECKEVEALWDVVGCKEHQGLVEEMNQAAAFRSLH